jgi:WD40 repeat protein
VAVGKKRQIVSASDDRTARVWDLISGMNTVLYHSTEVRAVVCTGPKAEQNLCLTGGADGIGRLWDLDNLNAAPRALADRHRGPIASVAFSPDGKLCVTGGGPQDRSVRVWNVVAGTQVGPSQMEHRGEVTSLQFLSPTLLISLGSDRSLIAWKLNADGTVTEKTAFRRPQRRRRPSASTRPGPSAGALVDYGRDRVVSGGDEADRGRVAELFRRRQLLDDGRCSRRTARRF